MSAAKRLYHRLIPETIRNPFGLFRRRIVDQARRAITFPSVPPAELLGNIQMTPYASEYLAIGRRSAATVRRLLDAFAHTPSRRLLDFGCGSARLLRHLQHSDWQLSGCDVDAPAIKWAAKHIRFATFRVNAVTPPLPYESSSFDAIVAISLFTHFGDDAQKAWFAELARLLSPAGILIVSTMGPSVIENFAQIATPQNRALLDAEGFLFVHRGDAFNSNAAFHSLRGLQRLASPDFDVALWSQQGLDGFQDVAVLRRL